MKKMLSLILAMVFVVSLSALSVSAADPTSDATLEITAGSLEIVDPPLPGDPELGGVQGGGKNMNFGIREVSTSHATYFALKTGTPLEGQETEANYLPVGLVVSDARGDGAAKWYVKVKVSQFNNAVPAETLKGFELTLKHDETVGIVGPGDAANKPSATATVMMAADGAPKDILGANALGSAGKWGGNWQPELLVKAGTATVANHKATVTWSITETP